MLRRLAPTLALLALAGMAACAGLLGLEDFTDDPGTGGAGATETTTNLGGGGSGGIAEGGAAGAMGGAGGAMGGAGGAGGAGGGGLVCDPRFSFAPNPPQADQAFVVTYTDSTAWVYIGLDVQPPPAAIANGVAEQGPPPYWTFAVTAPAGIYTLTFTRQDTMCGPTIQEGTCMLELQP